MRDVVILMAMHSEAEPLIERLGARRKTAVFELGLPFICYEAALGDLVIRIVISGEDDRYSVANIGTVPAALMAYCSLQALQPDLIFSAGTAGGFSSKGAKIGTVYLSDREFVFHDRNVPMPGYDESGVGHYPALNVRRMAHDLQLPYGVISSGSSLKKAESDISMMRESGAVAKEMEAAAIAWVCWLKNTPLIGIKAITNILDNDEESEAQFLCNLKLASDELSRAVLGVLTYIRGKSIQELADGR